MPHPDPARLRRDSDPGQGLTLAHLAQLLPDATLVGRGRAVLRDATLDSRQAGDGVLFCARPGQRADGHDFAPAAVEAGSPALLVQRPLAGVGVDQLIVPSVAEAVGTAAAAIHGDPTADLALVGVTGTNGKTTTTYLMDAIWRAAGARTGLVGTVETRIADEVVAGIRTTPEATDLQRLFARMRREGVEAASMEVSSHGLALGRMRGVRLRAALFTNLTQDHLDFHPTMEDYFQAKARLFTPAHTGLAVVTIDDAYGRRMAEHARAQGVDVWTLSRDPETGADVIATDVTASADGATFVAVVAGKRQRTRIRLPGDYNVTNALGAMAVLHRAGVDLPVAAEGLDALPGVPGRMERVDVGQAFGVLVDYAHTPDSVANVLSSARGVTAGRLTVVLGCGGDRDVAKRPLMARAAVANADRAIFTSDNPRSEDPEKILDDMMVGLADPGAVTRIADRADAIVHAIQTAEPGDVVVIAGKGHEPYQELAEGRIDFDDRLVAREALERSGR